MSSIRLATPTDLEPIQACARASYLRYVKAIGQEPAPMNADFGRQIAKGSVWAYVAIKDDLQGFIVFYPQDSHMMLENVAVFPAAAGQGIGRALITFCEDRAAALGLASVRLYTNEKMSENLLIYPHLGYCEVERRRQDGFARVFFEKQL